MPKLYMVNYEQSFGLYIRLPFYFTINGNWLPRCRCLNTSLLLYIILGEVIQYQWQFVRKTKERCLKQVQNCPTSFSTLEIIKHKKWIAFFQNTLYIEISLFLENVVRCVLCRINCRPPKIWTVCAWLFCTTSVQLYSD